MKDLIEKIKKARIVKIGKSDKSKIGGWLYLVIFGYLYIVYQQLQLIIDIFRAYRYKPIDVLYFNRHESLVRIVNFELVTATFVVAFVGYILWLLFKKDSKFPIYAFLLIIFTQVTSILDMSLIQIVNGKTSMDSIKELLISFAIAMVWSFYYLTSEKVKKVYKVKKVELANLDFKKNGLKLKFIGALILISQFTLSFYGTKIFIILFSK